MTIETREFTDLSKAAIERCRKQASLTIQLLDGDKEQIAAILTSIAVDMIRGAAIAISGPGDQIDRRTALDLILISVATAIGTVKRVQAEETASGRSAN